MTEAYDALAAAFQLQREPWMDLAACADKRTRMFFPERGNNTRSAKAICKICPVADSCGEYAERTGSVGVWGGELHTLFTRSSSEDENALTA